MFDLAVYYEIQSLIDLLYKALEVQRERVSQFYWKTDSKDRDIEVSDDCRTITAMTMSFRTILGTRTISSGQHFVVFTTCPFFLEKFYQLAQID